MKITKNSVVSFEYTLKNSKDEIIDSSEGQEPLEYIQGMGHIIPGLESEMEGKGADDAFDITIAPKDAYGERNDEMVQVVPKDHFDNANEIQPGMQFEVDTEDGPLILTVLDVKDEGFVLDGNHPLAGETLHFDVKIISVREATEEELEHDHVHSDSDDDGSDQLH